MRYRPRPHGHYYPWQEGTALDLSCELNQPAQETSDGRGTDEILRPPMANVPSGPGCSNRECIQGFANYSSGFN